MTKDHKDILKKHFPEIVQNITPGVLIRKLVAENILSPEEQQELNAEKVDVKRAEQLLQLLLKREDRGFDVFEGECRKSCQHHVANLLVAESTGKGLHTRNYCKFTITVCDQLVGYVVHYFRFTRPFWPAGVFRYS